MPRQGNIPEEQRRPEEIEQAPEFIPEPAHVFEVQVPIEVERPVDPRPIPADPIYERQASLINLEELPAVMIIGAGGVGCWIALALALGGVRYIDLFDGDSLSTHNLNRFPLPMSSVGSLKSEALANWLRELRPETEIIARGSFDSAIHTRVADWLVCATDSLKSRRMCYDYAQRNGMRYLEVGADGERWTLSPSPPEFSTENESQPGYQTVPVHVGPCMMAGAAAAYYVLHNCAPIASHSVGWIKGPIIRAMPNLGGLKFESMSEVNFAGAKFVTCDQCGVEIEISLIEIIRHLRDERGLGLVEAKELAENWLATLPVEVESELEVAGVAGDEDIPVDEINPFGAGTPNTLGAGERASLRDMTIEEVRDMRTEDEHGQEES